MSEVLHAISRSKFELSAVLESVAEAAARLCRADGAVIFQLDGGLYRFAAGYSLVPAYLEIERQSIIAPGPGTVVGRAAITRQVIRIDDLLSDPLYKQKEESKVEGNRSMIGVPLMRDGEPVVVIGLGRRRIDPFGDREIELATTFAAQAMIAIEKRGCSMNCGNRSSNKPRPRRCCKPSPELPATSRRCLRPCSRKRPAFVRRNSPRSTASKETGCASRRPTTCRRHLRRPRVW